MSRREGGEDFAQSLDEAIEGALSGLAKSSLEFGEGQFDRVEIRAVRREIEQGGAGRGDRLGDTFDLVGGEVVADDDIARAEFGHEDFAQVSQEGRSVHGAIQEPGSGQAIVAQGRDEGGALPVAVRHGGQAALAAFAAAIEAAHLGVESRLIQKDQPPVIPAPLLFPPALPGSLKLRPILLGGAQRFF